MHAILEINNIKQILWIAYGIWNFITFSQFGIDKAKAKGNKWRIKESTLIWCAFMMGAVGSCLGSKVFHHKTQKAKFKILLPVALVLNLLLLGLTIAWFKGVI